MAEVLEKHITEGLTRRGYRLNHQTGTDDEARGVLGPDPLLFTTRTGLPLPRTRFALRIWGPAIKMAGLDRPQPTFHDLRHSYAAWLINLEPSTHVKVIQERLGHSSIRTTMDVYGHLLEGVGDDYDALDEAFRWHDGAGRGTPVARLAPPLRAVEGD